MKKRRKSSTTLTKAEIDMSGRIEEFTRPTVLALTTNTISKTVGISGSQKLSKYKSLKLEKPDRDKTTICVIIFTELIVSLLKDTISKLGLVHIDHEYTGYEALIKNRVLSLLQKKGIVIDKETIRFKSVGKESLAHIKAITGFRRLRRKQK